MYMSSPQFEQLMKDRHASAQHSARLVASKGKRNAPARRLRVSIT